MDLKSIYSDLILSIENMTAEDFEKDFLEVGVFYVKKSELKPCPFCGGEPDFHRDSGWTAWFGCTKCTAEGAYFDDDEEGWKKAYEAWQSRA